MAEQNGGDHAPNTTSSRSFTRVASATSLLPPASAQGLTAADLLSHQALLESQAREAIPFTHSECTYTKGYIRQPLWACKDCGGGAVCAGCSIADHFDHNLVELFAKRATRCDCGTLSLQRNLAVPTDAGASTSSLKPCSLRPSPLNFAPENDLNVYNKNYDGAFCFCERGYTYDPIEEEETMFQCMVCEDWLHETCVSLRPRGNRRGEGKPIHPSDVGTADKPELEGVQPIMICPAVDSSIAADASPLSNAQGTTTTNADYGGEEEDAPPLISHDSFDNVICDSCLRSHPILQHYVGAPSWGACLRIPPGAESTIDAKADGATMIEVRAEDGKRNYLILGLPINDEYAKQDDGVQSTQPILVGSKRELSPIIEGVDDDGEGQDSRAKRLKGEEPAAGPADIATTRSSSQTSSSPLASILQTAEQQNISPDNKSASSSICHLPPVHPLVARLLSLPNALAGTAAHPNNPGNAQRPSYRVDLYLNEGNSEEDDPADPLAADFGEGGISKGFRKEICRCPSCLEAFKDLPFILEEEETYSPPASQSGLPLGIAAGEAEEDDDARSASSRSSTYDLGLDALNRLPRAQTLEAMEGYGRLKSALFEHLRPFAASGRPVDEESIRRFFDEQRERDRQGR